MRAFLLYNPQAGRHRDHRAELVTRIAQELRDAGYSLEVAATQGPDTAQRQTTDAIARGAQVVFACGGDGTVHHVLQGIVGTGAALAIIPAGSANALARELRIPHDPVRAARAYAAASPVEVAVGKLMFAEEAKPRYFLSMAGAGADGALVYRMLTVNRSLFGRWMYAFYALLLFARMRFAPFPVEWQAQDGTAGQGEAVNVMALRIRSLGGVFPGVARGASLWKPGVRLVAVKPPAWLSLPLWFLGGVFDVNRWNPLLVQVQVRSFRWSTPEHGVDLQADGEWLGCMPVQGSIGDTTIKLLLPKGLRRPTPPGGAS